MRFSFRLVLTVALLTVCTSLIQAHTFGTSQRQRGATPLPMRWEKIIPRQFYLPGNDSSLYTGTGVRVALLDTGLDPVFQLASLNNVSCISVVPNVSCGDRGYEHGTLSTSVLAGNLRSSCEAKEGDDEPWSGQSSLCEERYEGMAPDATILMIRIFDENRESDPAFIAQALDIAEEWGAKVINLSFSSENYWESCVRRRVEKLLANGVVIVAAAGNNGPEFGTVSHPADVSGVVAVGSTLVACPRLPRPPHCTRDAAHFFDECCTESVASFSGRGPSTWEFPFGAGRMKPDLVAAGEHVIGVRGISASTGTWNVGETFGTSVSSPVVSGLVALCIQVLVDDGMLEREVNAAVIKNLLITTAEPLKPTQEEVQRAVDHRQKWDQDRNASRLSPGTPLTRVYEEYAMLLKYSMYSQGAGAMRATAALARARQWGKLKDTLYVLHPTGIHAVNKKKLASQSDTTAAGVGGPESSDDNFWWNWPFNEEPLFPRGPPHLMNLTFCASKLDVNHASTHAMESLVKFRSVECDGNVSIEGTPLLGHEKRLLSSQTWTSVLEVKVDVVTAPEKLCGTVTIMTYARENFFSAPLLRGCTGVTAFGVVLVPLLFSTMQIPFAYSIRRPPPRHQRLLWDTAHQWMNPTGGSSAPTVRPSPPLWVPGDDPHNPNVKQQTRRVNQPEGFGEYSEPSGGDHPHTNGALLYLYLRRELGLHVDFFPLIPEVEEITDGNSRMSDWWKRAFEENGVLLLMDPELPLIPSFRKALREAIAENALHVIIVGEWSNNDLAAALSASRDDTGDLEKSNEDLRIRESGCSSPTAQESFQWVRDPVSSSVMGVGLNGSFHARSLNALLLEISNDFQLPVALQFSDTVVDGMLLFPQNTQLDHGVIDGMEPIRSIGRLSGGSTIVLQDVPFSFSASRSSMPRISSFMWEALACNLPGANRYRRLSKRSQGSNEELIDEWENAPNTSTWRTFGVLEIPSSRPRLTKEDRFSRVVLFSDSNCLSSSDGRVRGLLHKMLSAHQRHTLTRCRDPTPSELLQSLSHPDHYGTFLRELERSESLSSSACLELMKELLHTAFVGSKTWLCGREHSPFTSRMDSRSGSEHPSALEPLRRTAPTSEGVQDADSRSSGTAELRWILEATPHRWEVGKVVRRNLQAISASPMAVLVDERRVLQNFSRLTMPYSLDSVDRTDTRAAKAAERDSGKQWKGHHFCWAILIVFGMMIVRKIVWRHRLHDTVSMTRKKQ